MGIREMADSRGPGSLYFDPDKIMELPGYNVRNMESVETQAHIDRMVQSIMESGTETFPPITVKLVGEDVFVVAGYCRRRAFSRAKELGAPIKGILSIPVSVKNDADLTLDLLASNDGLPLTPIEKACAVKRLMSFGWTVAEIARRRGCSPTAISNLVDLLDTPAPVQEMVRNGEVSATLAVKTVAEKGAEAGTHALKGAVEKAKAGGKTKATGKHVAKDDDSHVGLTVEMKNSHEIGDCHCCPGKSGDYMVWVISFGMLSVRVCDVGRKKLLARMQN